MTVMSNEEMKSRHKPIDAVMVDGFWLNAIVTQTYGREFDCRKDSNYLKGWPHVTHFPGNCISDTHDVDEINQAVTTWINGGEQPRISDIFDHLYFIGKVEKKPYILSY